MTNANRVAQLNESDPALDAMVEEIANLLQAGNEVDLEAIARRDPDRAKLLQQLLPSIQMMANLGRSIVQDAVRAESPGSGPDALGALGDYRILREVGRGGMGIVYEAEQVSLGRRVALKVLPLAAAFDSKQLTRFHLEAQAAAQLQHTNIVPVYAVGCERDLNFYAMQFIEGPCLAAVIRELRRRDGVDTNGPPGGAGMASAMAVDLAEGRFESARSQADPGPEESRPTESGSPPISDARSASIAEPVARQDRARGEAYFRAVAHLGVQAAEAMDHAHGMGIVHRDIKPANLLIDVRGNLWITDFGLAQMQGGSDLTLSGDLLGTLRYMSPEQALARRIVVDYRTDIYSLGVTLYELVTLAPAFEGLDRQEVLHRIASEEPRPPRRIDPSIPRELETIVLKAMSKEPGARYATALEMAADLRRFLHDEPIHAKRPTALERTARWARRHQSITAAAFAILLVTVGVLSISTVLIAREKGRAVAAERESRHESLLQKIQSILSTSHTSGWFDEVSDRVREAARLAPKEGHRLQGYAAGSLGGLDAHLRKQINIETAALGFDPGGTSLYVCDTNGQAWVWDGSANPVRKIGATGVGPFAFKPDGTAVQLFQTTPAEPAEIELRAFEPAKTLRRYRSPIGPGSKMGSITLTPDAAFVAATILSKEGRGYAAVWNGDTGEMVRQVEIDRPTQLALTPDGRWLAVGTEDGEVAAWHLAEATPLPRFAAGRVAISTLAFGPDRLRRAKPTRPGDAWLLAAGDVATGLTVFDLSTRSIRSRCRGSNYDLRAVSFSPEGMLLASSGHEQILWDASTGRPILRLADLAYATSIVFSPDGRRVAVGNRNANGSSQGVRIFELENGRGFQTLWGLDARIERTISSSDNRLIAALAMDFRVGIWDRSAGRLLHVLEVPIGVFSDNAGLAFSPDGRRFAFAAGTLARVWDVETGEVLQSWTLPAGFQDNLAFLDADRLISTRVETTDPGVPPYGTDPTKYPRVLRIRNLDAGNPKLLAELFDFNLHVFYSEMTRDGRSLLIEGRSGPREAPVRLLKAFDIAAKRELWSVQDSHPEIAAAWFGFDPTGRIYARTDRDHRLYFHEFFSRALLETYEWNHPRGYVSCLSPGARLRLSFGGPDDRETLSRIRLWGPRQELLMVMDQATVGGGGQFSLDGRLASWGNSDGTVTVFEPKELQDRLARFGLGW